MTETLRGIMNEHFGSRFEYEENKLIDSYNERTGYEQMMTYLVTDKSFAGHLR